MLPVVIVAGLHADARRTVVDALLRAVPRSVALHHDLTTAADGTVRRVLDLVFTCPAHYGRPVQGRQVRLLA